MIAAFGAYIANALVTYYAGTLTSDDWDSVETYLSQNHYSNLMATIYLTYVVNALVFIHPYIAKCVYLVEPRDYKCHQDCEVRVS